jgi:uncharacterized protein DUF5681
MTKNTDGYEVGRGRPPRHTRWKKGQSGNPRRGARRKIETAAEMIDRLLAVPVKITVNGEKQRVTTLAAIMFALSQKAFSGNIRAKRALLKYVEFAKTNSERKPQLTFVDGDYSRAVAGYSGVGDA